MAKIDQLESILADKIKAIDDGKRRNTSLES